MGEVEGCTPELSYKPSLWPLGVVWGPDQDPGGGETEAWVGFLQIAPAGVHQPPSTVRKGFMSCVGRGGPVYSLPSGSSTWLWKGCNAQPVFGTSLAKGVSLAWAGKWHHPDVGMMTEFQSQDRDPQPGVGCIFQLG